MTEEVKKMLNERIEIIDKKLKEETDKMVNKSELSIDDIMFLVKERDRLDKIQLSDKMRIQEEKNRKAMQELVKGFDYL